MRVASVYVESWDKKFVVVCDFNGLQLISNTQFNYYSEAVEEMGKQIARELIRISIRP